MQRVEGEKLSLVRLVSVAASETCSANRRLNPILFSFPDWTSLQHVSDTKCQKPAKWWTMTVNHRILPWPEQSYDTVELARHTILSLSCIWTFVNHEDCFCFRCMRCFGLGKASFSFDSVVVVLDFHCSCMGSPCLLFFFNCVWLRRNNRPSPLSKLLLVPTPRLPMFLWPMELCPSTVSAVNGDASTKETKRPLNLSRPFLKLWMNSFQKSRRQARMLPSIVWFAEDAWTSSLWPLFLWKISAHGKKRKYHSLWSLILGLQHRIFFWLRSLYLFI